MTVPARANTSLPLPVSPVMRTGASEAARYYEQMGTDEDHHGAIFALFIEALDDAGTLGAGWTAERMRERLAAIGSDDAVRAYVDEYRRAGATIQLVTAMTNSPSTLRNGTRGHWKRKRASSA